MHRLYPRGQENFCIAVDADGAMLGPDCVLVQHATQGYRCIDPDEADALQSFLFGKTKPPGWLFGRCQEIALALDDDEIALAQIHGLYLGVGKLDGSKLSQLAAAARFIKANFNVYEPRIPKGDGGAGRWTDDGGSGDQSNAGTNSVVSAQVTIPWDLPTDIPWKIPGFPTEITPVPFDFPGAERKRPPFPTNSFPRDPECSKEWDAAYEFCEEQKRNGKLGRHSGFGKDYRSCLLGQVSARCGGHAV